MAVHAVVVGGGIGGLGTALALGRAGHRVTVLERDPLPATADAEAAFAAERRGAPQVHQTHGFLARIQVLLRERFPDVFAELLATGCTTLPTTLDLGDPRPGDEDLSVLIVRRTTLEWVLRRAAMAQPNVDIRTGVSVTGLVPGDPGDDGRGELIPRVAGVHLGDGSSLAADVVVDAGGRRAPVPGWLVELGVDVPETVRPSGLVYVSRWYRFADGPHRITDPKLGGDLGFVKYLGVPGDGATLSVTLAVPSKDADLRAALDDEDRFDLACRLLPGPDRFFVGDPPAPLGPVRVMGGLLNRIRRFTADGGEPLVLGFHAVGDAHTCTNPLYGRGCSLAMVQAVLLADALVASGDDDAARARDYEAGCRREVEPWFHSAVELDKAGADPAGLGTGGPPESAASRAMAAVFVAAATDPVLGRGMLRFWNLVATPAELAADPEFTARAAEVMANPDAYPMPPREGPSRDELLAALHDLEVTARAPARRTLMVSGAD